MIGKEAKERLARIVGRDYFSDRTEDLVLYGSDGSNQSGFRPEAAVRPADAAQTAAVVRTAREYRFPVVPRGAGSGLTGGALPEAGGLMVVLTRMNRILEIDRRNLLAEAEPGVVTADFQAEVEKAGLFYPPDPASRDFSTLGGNAAENAGGTRAVKYGVTRDYVMGLEAVLGTGETIRTGVRTVKGVVGYDLTRLLVGSEGTLGIITRLILRLVPLPQSRETLSAYFDDMAGAARTVADMTAEGIVPATLEFMDQASINCAEDYLQAGLDRSAGAMLLVETDGPAVQAEAEAERALAICRENGARQARRAADLAEAESMRRARRSISPALFRVSSGKMNEDIVVPRSRIPDMIERIGRISAETGFRIISFGHAGDGNIHVDVMYDKGDPDQAGGAHEAVRRVFAAALELGGTLSGEHGIGTTKRDFISMEIQEESLNLQKRIKQAFDPDNIMNPGKIFPG